MNQTAQLYLSDAIACLRLAMDGDGETQIGFAKYKIEEAERVLQNERVVAARHVANAKPGCPCRDCMVARNTSGE